jgi:hypothetical protein
MPRAQASFRLAETVVRLIVNVSSRKQSTPHGRTRAMGHLVAFVAIVFISILARRLKRLIAIDVKCLIYKQTPTCECPERGRRKTMQEALEEMVRKYCASVASRAPTTRKR